MSSGADRRRGSTIEIGGDAVIWLLDGADRLVDSADRKTELLIQIGLAQHRGASAVLVPKGAADLLREKVEIDVQFEITDPKTAPDITFTKATSEEIGATTVVKAVARMNLKALMKGSLRPGDAVIAINEQKCAEMNHAAVAALLTEAISERGLISMRVARVYLPGERNEPPLIRQDSQDLPGGRGSKALLTKGRSSSVLTGSKIDKLPPGVTLEGSLLVAMDVPDRVLVTSQPGLPAPRWRVRPHPKESHGVEIGVVTQAQKAVGDALYAHGATGVSTVPGSVLPRPPWPQCDLDGQIIDIALSFDDPPSIIVTVGQYPQFEQAISLPGWNKGDPIFLAMTMRAGDCVEILGLDAVPPTLRRVPVEIDLSVHQYKINQQLVVTDITQSKPDAGESIESFAQEGVRKGDKIVALDGATQAARPGLFVDGILQTKNPWLRYDERQLRISPENTCKIGLFAETDGDYHMAIGKPVDLSRITSATLKFVLHSTESGKACGILVPSGKDEGLSNVPMNSHPRSMNLPFALFLKSNGELHKYSGDSKKELKDIGGWSDEDGATILYELRRGSTGDVSCRLKKDGEEVYYWSDLKSLGLTTSIVYPFVYVDYVGTSATLFVHCIGLPRLAQRNVVLELLDEYDPDAPEFDPRDSDSIESGSGKLCGVTDSQFEELSSLAAIYGTHHLSASIKDPLPLNMRTDTRDAVVDITSHQNATNQMERAPSQISRSSSGPEIERFKQPATNAKKSGSSEQFDGFQAATSEQSFDSGGALGARNAWDQSGQYCHSRATVAGEAGLQTVRHDPAGTSTEHGPLGVKTVVLNREASGTSVELETGAPKKPDWAFKEIVSASRMRGDISNGNKTVSGKGDYYWCTGPTIPAGAPGIFEYEMKIDSARDTTDFFFGFGEAGKTEIGDDSGVPGLYYYKTYRNPPQLYPSGTDLDPSSCKTAAGDRVTCALDATVGVVRFYRNDEFVGLETLTETHRAGDLAPYVCVYYKGASITLLLSRVKSAREAGGTPWGFSIPPLLESLTPKSATIDAAVHVKGDGDQTGDGILLGWNLVDDGTDQAHNVVSGSGLARANGAYLPQNIPGYSGAQTYVKPGEHLVLMRWHREHWMLIDMGPGFDKYPEKGAEVLYKVASDADQPPSSGWEEDAGQAPAPTLRYMTGNRSECQIKFKRGGEAVVPMASVVIDRTKSAIDGALAVADVQPSSVASGKIHSGHSITEINGKATDGMTYGTAMTAIEAAGSRLALAVERRSVDVAGRAGLCRASVGYKSGRHFWEVDVDPNQTTAGWILRAGKTHSQLKAGVVYPEHQKLDSDGDLKLKLPDGDVTDYIRASRYLERSDACRQWDFIGVVSSTVDCSTEIARDDPGPGIWAVGIGGSNTMHLFNNGSVPTMWKYLKAQPANVKNRCVGILLDSDHGTLDVFVNREFVGRAFNARTLPKGADLYPVLGLGGDKVTTSPSTIYRWPPLQVDLPESGVDDREPHIVLSDESIAVYPAPAGEKCLECNNLPPAAGSPLCDGCKSSARGPPRVLLSNKPTSHTLKFDRVDSSGKVGVSVENRPSTSGVVLKKVEEGGLAHSAGCIAGDVMLSINGQSVSGMSHRSAVKLIPKSGVIEFEVEFNPQKHMQHVTRGCHGLYFDVHVKAEGAKLEIDGIFACSADNGSYVGELYSRPGGCADGLTNEIGWTRIASVKLNEGEPTLSELSKPVAVDPGSTVGLLLCGPSTSAVRVYKTRQPTMCPEMVIVPQAVAKSSTAFQGSDGTIAAELVGGLRFGVFGGSQAGAKMIVHTKEGQRLTATRRTESQKDWPWLRIEPCPEHWDFTGFVSASRKRGEISAGGKTVKGKGDWYWCTGTAIPAGAKQVFSFQVKVNAVRSISDLFFGFGKAGLTSIGDDADVEGIYCYKSFRSTPTLHPSGKTLDSETCKTAPGDIVRCDLDTRAAMWTISFFRNGTFVGAEAMAAQDISHGVAPYVTVYHSSTSVTLHSVETLDAVDIDGWVCQRSPEGIEQVVAVRSTAAPLLALSTGLATATRGKHHVVTGVAPDSPAATAGVTRGHMIMSICGVPCHGQTGTVVEALLERRRLGDVCELKLVGFDNEELNAGRSQSKDFGSHVLAMHYDTCWARGGELYARSIAESNGAAAVLIVHNDEVLKAPPVPPGIMSITASSSQPGGIVSKPPSPWQSGAAVHLKKTPLTGKTGKALHLNMPARTDGADGADDAAKAQVGDGGDRNDADDDGLGHWLLIEFAENFVLDSLVLVVNPATLKERTLKERIRTRVFFGNSRDELRETEACKYRVVERRTKLIDVKKAEHVRFARLEFFKVSGKVPPIEIAALEASGDFHLQTEDVMGATVPIAHVNVLDMSKFLSQLSKSRGSDGNRKHGARRDASTPPIRMFLRSTFIASPDHALPCTLPI